MDHSVSSKDSFDVIIVGYGPVGATLANLLGLCGVSTLVLERESQAYHLPRAVHFDDEVMRVFQTIGVSDLVVDTTRINPGMRFVDPKGNTLLDWPRPQDVGPQGWHASYRFHQPDLERILRNATHRFPLVEVRTRSDVFFLRDHGEQVELQYRDLKNGENHSVDAKFVVGCDGARSLVRRSIGTAMLDHGFHERWLVVDALLKRDKPELGDRTIQYCNPDRPATYVRGPLNRRRWEITVLDNEASEEVSQPDVVWGLLESWITPDEAELERTAVYTFHSLIAEQWRKGRLLLAGDAAHQTPPFMGQGMCAGIRDVSNLAWKLALCLKNQTNDELLDTYQAERHPHTGEYIETAIRLGGLINTCGTQDALRSALQQPNGSARMTSIMPRLGRGLAAGNRNHSGCIAMQPRLKGGRFLDDVIGYAPVLLACERIWRQDGTNHATLAAAEIPVLIDKDEPEIAALLSQLNCDAALIRPDRYILGTAKNASELAELCSNTPHSPINSLMDTA